MKINRKKKYLNMLEYYNTQKRKKKFNNNIKEL